MNTILILIALAALYTAIKKYGSSDQPALIDIPKPKLPIELVPASMHGCNVRSRLSTTQWKYICDTTHATPKYKQKACVICGEDGKKQGFKHSLECHEQWQYDLDTNTQKLVNLLSICPMCHKVFHYGLSKRTGYGDKAYQHLKKVNGWNDTQADLYISQVNADIKRRSKVDWQLDLTFLNSPKYHFLHTKFTTNEKYNCDMAMGEY